MSLKLHQVLKRPAIRGFLLKEFIQVGKNGTNSSTAKPIVKLASPSVYHELPMALAALHINSVRTPPASRPFQERIPPPMPQSRVLELPQIRGTVSYEEQTPSKSIEDPFPSTVQEKQAARLIVIRRHKMKKHKLRKLRKRMRFEWAKIRQKRELKKEKLFQAFLVGHINEALKFDPAKYAADKIARAKEVELPEHWHGYRYPEFIIKQLMEEKEEKDKQKEADEKRRASMSPYVKDYLGNLPK